MEVSPRIIEIADTSTEVVIQDLHDTLVHFEDTSEGGQYPRLVLSTGKEDLGDNLYVGITLTLQNAKLKFADRDGPQYVQCSVKGGNLVAIDTNGDAINPIESSTYVQVIRTSSTSATLQELNTIQYGSYNNGVMIDVINGVSGTTYPIIGTPITPVNNLQDALIISNNRFNKLYIKSDITSSDSDVLDNYIIIGHFIQQNTITLSDGCSTHGTIFKDLVIEGIQNGITNYVRCELKSLSNIRGSAEKCKLVGPLVLYSNSQNTIVWLNCYSAGETSLHTTIIDMNNSQINLSIRGFTGKLKFINCTNSQADVGIDLVSGHITLDSTCTAGNFEIRGSGIVTNNSIGTTVSDETINLSNISNYVSTDNRTVTVGKLITLR